MLWKWKFPIFEKQLFYSITFIFIYGFTWNIDEINDFLKVWPFLAFIGLLAFVVLDDFLKQKLAFADKNQAQLTCFQ